MVLTLALHELQTNAIKYGALSWRNGSVDLFWKVIGSGGDARLWMQWAECDGPAVAVPERQGSGTRLITSATSRSIGGDASLDYASTGLTWMLTAPHARICAE